MGSPFLLPENVHWLEESLILLLFFVLVILLLGPWIENGPTQNQAHMLTDPGFSKMNAKQNAVGQKLVDELIMDHIMQSRLIRFSREMLIKDKIIKNYKAKVLYFCTKKL